MTVVCQIWRSHFPANNCLIWTLKKDIRESTIWLIKTTIWAISKQLKSMDSKVKHPLADKSLCPPSHNLSSCLNLPTAYLFYSKQGKISCARCLQYPPALNPPPLQKKTAVIPNTRTRQCHVVSPFPLTSATRPPSILSLYNYPPPPPPISHSLSCFVCSVCLLFT